MTEPVITSFCVVYDGPAHENHEINILTLGEALTALGKVILEADETLNGSGMLDVRVNADFIEGSFGVMVELVQNYQDAKNILDFLGFTIVNTMSVAGTAGTVVGALQWLKGRDILQVEDSGDDDNLVTIVVEGEQLEVEREIAEAVTKPDFRKSIENLIAKPLENPGTDSFSIFSSPSAPTPTLQIIEKELGYFRGLKILPTQEEQIVEQKIKFTAANIKGKTGWRAEILGEEVSIKMHDQSFIDRLANRTEAYLFGKTFTVSLKTVTITRLSKQIKNHIVEKVYHES